MRTTLFKALVFGALVAAPTLAMAQTPSVDSYTPAEEAKAKAAARAADYDPGIVTMAQAGNLFIDATRGGQTYTLTVTPDDKVYASTLNPGG